MSPRGGVNRGRRMAAAAFFSEDQADQCRSTRAGGPPTFDPITGSLTPGTVEVYVGPCRVRAPALEEVQTIFGEDVITTTKFVALLPWDAPAHLVGDVIQVTETEDPQLAARPLRVVAIPVSTFLLYRSLGVEVIDR